MKRLLLSLMLLAGCATTNSPTPTVDRQPFTVEVTGSGPPMVFIPGLSSPGAVWNETVAHYSTTHECHVLSLAGFAGSPTVDGPLLPQTRDALARYLREKHLEQAVVVGHSLGGFLGVWLAETEPELLRGLVVVDSAPSFAALQNPDATGPEMVRMADAMRDQLRQADRGARAKAAKTVGRMMATAPESQAKVEQWSIASDPDTVADAMHLLVSTDLRAELGKVKVPTLVIGTWVAYQPYLTRAEVLERFTAQYQACTTCTVTLNDTARHFVMLDDEPGLETAIDQFLAQKVAAR